MNKFVLALLWPLSLLPVQSIAAEPPVIASPIPSEQPVPDLPIPAQPPTQPPFTLIQVAVEVNLGSMGGSIDNAAIRAVRRIVGHAVATGVVDTFIDTSPRNNGSIPIAIEGGLSFCAESGFEHGGYQFMEFIDELVSIQPNNGTFYNINKVENCFESMDDVPGDDDTVCTADVKMCPDGSYVDRVPPGCGFAPCPAPPPEPEVNEETDPVPPQSEVILPPQ